MSAHVERHDALIGDDDLFSGEEHLRPAWQVVVLTVVLVGASVLVLAIGG